MKFSISKLVWSLLAGSAILQLAVLTSELNFLFTDQSMKINLGPMGGLQLQMSDHFSKVVSAAVVIIAFLAMVVAFLDMFLGDSDQRMFYPIIAGTVGAALFGGMYANVLPFGEGQALACLFIAGLIMVVLTIILIWLDWFREDEEVLDTAVLPERATA